MSHTASASSASVAIVGRALQIAGDPRHVDHTGVADRTLPTVCQGMRFAETDAVRALAALAQETRLEIVRLLAGQPDGLAAGAIAEAVGASPSNVSRHLRELEMAGLVASRRASRSIIYSAKTAAVLGLADHLATLAGGRPR